MAEEEKKAKKPAAKKPAKKEGAAGKKPAAEKKVKPEQPEPAPEEKAEEKPPVEEQAPAGEEAPEEERELTEDELRALIEQEMEKITVKDILGSAMMELIRQAYRRMGLPEAVNLKYKDLEQASLAIDALMGILAAMEKKVPENEVAPYRSTLANLQMNYARLASQAGSN